MEESPGGIPLFKRPEDYAKEQAGQRQIEKEKAAESRDREKHKWEGAQLVVSILGFSVNVLMFLVVGYQSMLTRDSIKAAQAAVAVARDGLNASIASGKASDEQARLSREAAEAQSKTAVAASAQQNRDTLDATAKNAKGAIDASVMQMRLEQRAWIGVVDLGDTPPKLTPGTTDVFSVNTTNFGKTLAHDVFQVVGQVTLPTGPPIDVEKEIAKLPLGLRRQGIVQPSNIRTTLRTAAVPNTPYGKKLHDSIIEDESSKLYVVGLTTYLDIFNNVRHHTKFCFFLHVMEKTIPGPPLAKIKVPVGFATCDGVNDNSAD